MAYEARREVARRAEHERFPSSAIRMLVLVLPVGSERPVRIDVIAANFDVLLAREGLYSGFSIVIGSFVAIGQTRSSGASINTLQ